MIKNIEKLKEQSAKYIKDFMLNCTIEEKIDTHYVCVEIISKNEIKIKKANGKEIDRVDLILNSMWNKLFLDWNYLLLSNKDWFESHVGYGIKMFYFPCEKPINTLYDENLRYIFDYTYFKDNIYDAKEVLSSLKFPDAYKIDYKCLLNKVSPSSIRAIYQHHIHKLLNGEEDFTTVFMKLIKDDSKIFAKEIPEGFIFKYNKKIFQIENNKIEVEAQEKSSYEFLLSDFIKFSKMHNYIDRVNASYTKSVCNLFNNYIINGEKITHTIENNIDIKGIESPYIGEKFDIGFEYIPDQVTKELCKESELYKNIFKVLLANLRKGKDETHCIFLTKKEVNDWNLMMKSIKMRNLYI